MRPDFGTLDAMVQGLDDADDADAWQWLVYAEDGADAWEHAAGQRARLDAFSNFILQHPLATSLLARARSLSAMPGRVAILFRGEPDLATLGPSSGQNAPRSVQWGQSTVFSARIGQLVRLDADPVWGLPSNGDALRIPDGDGWRLEANEAPVLLLALRGASTAETFAEATANATAIASVLLIEERGETSEP